MPVINVAPPNSGSTVFQRVVSSITGANRIRMKTPAFTIVAECR